MTAKWNISAALLDMDGTLLDTEKIYFESFVLALNANGYADGAAALCHAMVGLPGPACEAMLLEHHGERFPLAEINRAYVANRDRIMEAGLPLKPGTLELLDALAATDCPMAIVTASSRRAAERHLLRAGIRSRFDTVLTLDDVTHGKPRRTCICSPPRASALRRRPALQWRIQITASHPPMPPARSPSWCRTWCRRPSKRARCARPCCRI